MLEMGIKTTISKIQENLKKIIRRFRPIQQSQRDSLSVEQIFNKYSL